MAKGEGLKKAFTDLYNEFGRPLVNRIMDELGADATPQQVRRAAKQTAPSLSAKPKKPLAVQKALPAPPKPLALPAPGPGLPPGASKPRGGQWWIDKGYNNQFNSSPEEAAREGALGLALSRWTPDPDDYGVVARDAEGRLREALLGGQVQTVETDAQKWLERALTKYYKNDFGAPEDPLRDLAARGLHYDPEMTPEKWQATVNSYLMEDPIQHIMFPPNPAGGMPGAGSNFRGEVMSSMPWLAKLPSTDKVYGIQSGGLDLEHFTDEFYNALNPEVSGLPMDLAVRPESLDRMTFAQAVERVGKINQFRAKQQAEAMVSSFDNPAVHTFKEYPDDERGLRWVELKAPSFEGDKLPEGFEVRHLPTSFGDRWAAMDLRMPDAEGRHLEIDVQDTPEGAREAIMDYYGRDPLEQALKYEGDTMGHCVGGYCNDVLSGRSRIFSLRDAKGEPHVTIETKPTRSLPYEVSQEIDKRAWEDANAQNFETSHEWERFLDARRKELQTEWAAQQPDSIIQIKGSGKKQPGQRLRLSSQDFAGEDDYLLPYVQDFVRSQKWGNVRDLENTDLVRLPDGRYITSQQWKEGLGSVVSPWRNPEQYDERYLDNLSKAEWEYMAPYFEGFAIGGRVDADRCFCHNPLSVKKGR